MITITLHVFEPNHGYNYIWLLWKLYLITVNYNYWLRLPQVWFGPVVKEEMLFKRISYLVLWRPFCSAELNHLFNFGRRHHEAQSCEIILNLNRWFRKICHLKLLLIWRSVAPFTAEWIHLCNFGRGYHARGSFLWNNFDFGPVVQEEMSFKIFLISSSGGSCVHWSRTIYAILVEGIIRNLHVK